MKVRIIAVGKLKEKYLRAACDEYLKRLGPYAQVEVAEVAEEKVQEPISYAEMAKVLEKEGERILKLIPDNSHVFALAIQGKSLSSESFAEKLKTLSTYGQNHFTFIIGGSYGLSPSVLKRADFPLSFSAMTFPHQLIRVFLLEQIYRACKINRGEAYHK
jgi:23S rRNA (pseudouridine1915-N3)-methyltransferase